MASPSEGGRSRADSLCFPGNDNTAQWKLTTFQMGMEYLVKNWTQSFGWYWDCDWLQQLKGVWCFGFIGGSCFVFLRLCWNLNIVTETVMHIGRLRIECEFASAESDSLKTTGACATDSTAIYSIQYTHHSALLFFLSLLLSLCTSPLPTSLSSPRPLVCKHIHTPRKNWGRVYS